MHDGGHRHLRTIERTGDLIGLSCSYVVDVEQPEPGIHNRNRLPFSRLFLVAAATVDDRVTLGRRHWPLRAGTVLFMPPDQMLQFDFSPGLRMVACHFRLDWAPGCDAFDGVANCATLTDRVLVAEAYRLRDQAESFAGIAGLRGLILSTAARFARLDARMLARHLAARGRFAAVIERLDRADAGMRVSDLAAMMGLGREHFTREFRRHLGLSPMRWLHRRLVQRASAALIAGARVKAVAGDLGFTDEFYFSRFFKARTGLAPSALRDGALSAYAVPE
ncbi:MAG: helix-turn-helix domain-containing protein [Planctomycetes bacterium]|nr:helix-turn-helix domain-containing protein [Planctomycetota bacterium]